MKKYTIEEIKKYLDGQDSLGDIHYNLTEENIDAANKPLTVDDFEYDPNEDYPFYSIEEVESYPEQYMEDTYGSDFVEQLKNQ